MMKAKEGASAMEELRTEFSRRASRLRPSANTASPSSGNLGVTRRVTVQIHVVLSSASVLVPHPDNSYYSPLGPPNFLSQEFELYSPQRPRRRP